MLQKGVYRYECMDDWEKFSETALLKKQNFCSPLNTEDITDSNDTHTKRVCKVWNKKFRKNWRDLYVQSNTSLLADVFENFWNMCLEIYELDPAHFLSTQVSAWQAAFKKTKGKLYLRTDIDMLLMVEKVIWERTCHSIYQYTNARNK